MSLIQPAVQLKIDRLKASVTAKLDGKIDCNPHSFEGVFINVVSEALVQMEESLINKIDNSFLYKATDEEKILDLAGEVGAIRKEGTKAAGSIKIFGSSANILIDSTKVTFKSSNGNLYKVLLNATTTASNVPNQFFAILQVESLEVGSDNNLVAGAKLTINSLVTGLENEATVEAGGIVGGSDIESIKSVQARGIKRKQALHTDTGNHHLRLDNDVVQNTDCTRAWCYKAKNYNEAGTVTVVSVNDNQNPITLNSAQLTSQKTWYSQTTQPPFLSDISVYFITANLVSVNITINNLLPADNALYLSIKEELKNLFQEKSNIKRVLDPNDLSPDAIIQCIRNSRNAETNDTPKFNNSDVSVSGTTLINDHDLPVFGTLTINNQTI